MNCQEAQRLIHAYIDNELDLVNSLEIESHLQDCSTCALVYKNNLNLRSAIKSSALYYNPPAGLEKRVLSSVRQASRGADRRPRPVLSWGWLGMAAALAATIILTFGLTRVFFTPSMDDMLTQQVIASHVRSQITNHQVDIVSSDQHTVKPWFSGKVDFSPAVQDLVSQGFPLVGGRLDYVDNRPVAVLVYRRQQHVINLFIWTSTDSPDAPAKAEMHQGYNLSHWTKSGMTYWAITDLNAAEFQGFVKLVQSLAAQTVAP